MCNVLRFLNRATNEGSQLSSLSLLSMFKLIVYVKITNHASQGGPVVVKIDSFKQNKQPFFNNSKNNHYDNA